MLLKTKINLIKKYKQISKIKNLLKTDFVIVSFLKHNSDFIKVMKKYNYSFFNFDNRILKNLFNLQYKLFRLNCFGNCFLLPLKNVIFKKNLPFIISGLSLEMFTNKKFIQLFLKNIFYYRFTLTYFIHIFYFLIKYLIINFIFIYKFYFYL